MVPAERVTLTELAAKLGVNPATTFRWAGRGIRGVRLGTQRLGGRTVVTPESLREFLAALNSTRPSTRANRRGDPAGGEP
ncbi:MAG: DUF1580 domain-containing protein [Phycisphaerales bacterium]